MRLFVAAVMVLAAGCTNDLMKVEFVSASASGVGGHWFIGAELGETIELRFVLDPADISDPAGWSVKIDGPAGADTVVELTDQNTVGAVTVPQDASDSFRKLKDETFTFHLLDPDGTVRESRQWAATIVDHAGSAGRAWLWGAFWTADGERLTADFTECSEVMSVVAYVGGDLSAASSVKISIIDVDLVTDDETISSASFTIQPGKRMYESVLENPCAGENGSGDSNNVDPKFTATLLGSDGSELDKIVGPELD